MRGDVFEIALPVVFKKPVGVFGTGLLECPDVGPIRKKDIGVAVVIEVEDRHSAGHGFGSVTLWGLAALHRKVDRPVGEMDRRAPNLAESRSP